MNVADSQRLASALERLGYSESPIIEEADVIVLNTCMVRQSAEDKAIGRLSSLKPLKKKNPDLVLGVMGCMVGFKDQTEIRKKLPYVDVFAPPSNPKPIIDFLIRQEYIGEASASRNVDAEAIWEPGKLTFRLIGEKTRSPALFRLFTVVIMPVLTVSFHISVERKEAAIHKKYLTTRVRWLSKV